MRQVTIGIIGAGSRGLTAYANYALKHPDRCRIVAVAEPRENFRGECARRFSIPGENVFDCWSDFVKKPRMADAVIIATPDRTHADPAVACLNLGYDVMLEKPMAPTMRDSLRIKEAALAGKAIFGVCHVLRYTPYYRGLRKIIESGVIGEVVTLRHIERVCYWHQAHSFVRGNWNNKENSAPMILAKCCHDTDILAYLLGDRKCVRVSSFGSLKHFRAECKPRGAADRCLDCKLSDGCVYSAKKFYFDHLKSGATGWPLDIVTPFNYTPDGLTEALEKGPYGRCVYSCDNDVVDNQVVNLEFDGGVTASMTMTAFTSDGGRRTEIYGTHGEITGNGAAITVKEFGKGVTTSYEASSFNSGMIIDGHGGGDGGIIEAFVKAVATRDPGCLSSGAETSFESHRMAFAAEESRVTGRTINI